MLRPFTAVLTTGPCMPLFAETRQELTEPAAVLVPRARRQASSDTAAHASLTRKPEDDEGPRPS
ncbi:hypothetical protein [Streptomyces sp. NPDC057702]|uniref:hypothetical protein n=1 Tax=unclassified Streptomyces TaxID=2593676 RepID=UPI0036B08156